MYCACFGRGLLYALQYVIFIPFRDSALIGGLASIKALKVKDKMK